MSNVAINPAANGPSDHQPDAGHGAHAHDPHLAHHFDTPEQQYASAKLGMWIFLGTEILMFGGLFCAYSVYRHNHPDVFSFAHQFLNKWLGAVNTIVLITSSLTMAWAVRSSQLGNSASLRWLMAVTILGGYIFLGVKSIEYSAKWNEYIFIGPHNQFNPERPKGNPEPIRDEQKEATEKARAKAEAAQHPVDAAMPADAAHPQGVPAQVKEPVNALDPVNFAPPDPNHGLADEAKITPTFANIPGLDKSVPEHHEEVMLAAMNEGDLSRIYTFFAVYFVMTGLHGLHVVIGMSLIMWVLIRALGPKHVAWAVPLIPGSIGVFLAVVGIIIMASPSAAHHPVAWDPGVVLIIAGLIIAVLSVLWAALWVPLRRNRSGESEFGPTYFTPVDLVGLYWHLVDLIWIFLFPLLYLIH